MMYSYQQVKGDYQLIITTNEAPGQALLAAAAQYESLDASTSTNNGQGTKKAVDEKMSKYANNITPGNPLLSRKQ